MKHKLRWTRRRIIAISCFGLASVAIAGFYGFAPSMSGEPVVRPEVRRHSAASQPAVERSGGQRDSLKVLTLNVAHGSGNRPNPILQKGETVRANLDEIAAVLRRERPDIAAVQEADGPSVWSGKIDQVSYLAEKGGFAYSVHGEHVKSKKICYGTGLLSMLALKEPLAITFDASPPTFSKGFVVATVDWPGEPNVKVDVVSVHLDFLRKSVRERQVAEMIDKLSSRGRALIVMGDFNSEWKSKESAVRAIAEGLNLKAYQPVSLGMDTFPLLRRRMDWILISAGLEFVRYEVLPDVISDHYAVVCEVKRAGE
ncbi:MAG: endonuclease/exonuclease/phosphatase family protein [Planctomycetota bacterium]|jgi:endonuclease/exonuclease/phosphatase family metal-dependent hydrolase